MHGVNSSGPGKDSSITTCVDTVMKIPQLPTIDSIGMQYEAQVTVMRQVADLSLVYIATNRRNADDLSGMQSSSRPGPRISIIGSYG